MHTSTFPLLQFCVHTLNPILYHMLYPGMSCQKGYTIAQTPLSHQQQPQHYPAQQQYYYYLPNQQDQPQLQQYTTNYVPLEQQLPQKPEKEWTPEEYQRNAHIKQLQYNLAAENYTRASEAVDAAQELVRQRINDRAQALAARNKAQSQLSSAKNKARVSCTSHPHTLPIHCTAALARTEQLAG